MTPAGRTVASLLTPLAPGAIAVIGLRGPAANAIVEKVLRRPKRDLAPDLPPNKPVFCRLVDESQVIDDVVAVRIRDAGDQFEINTHGGVRIAQRALLLLESAGAEIATGPDYIAMIGGEDPIRREIDLALMHAESRRLTQWLIRQREILPDYLDALALRPLEERLEFERRSRTAERLLRGLRIAVIGPPNAGKSTLANLLIGKDRIITSNQAGTTRDWVSETALIDGWPVALTDTAGLRQTDCGIEREAIRRAREQAGTADVILIVLDATMCPNDRQSELRTIVADGFAPPSHHLVILNKCDQLSDGAARAHATLPGKTPRVEARPDIIPISALRGDGIDLLQSRLCEILGLHLLRDDLPTAISMNMLEDC